MTKNRTRLRHPRKRDHFQSPNLTAEELSFFETQLNIFWESPSPSKLLNFRSSLDLLINHHFNPVHQNKKEPPLLPPSMELSPGTTESSRMKGTKIKKRKHHINNIVIHGITLTPEEQRGQTIKEKVESIFFDALKLEINLQDAFFLGDPLSNNNKPVLAKFRSYEDKKTVYQHLYKLKDTEYQHISIADDIPKEVRIERAKWRSRLMEEKGKGNEVRFKGGQLLVNGKIVSEGEPDFATMKPNPPQRRRKPIQVFTPEVFLEPYDSIDMKYTPDESEEKKTIPVSTLLIKRLAPPPPHASPKNESKDDFHLEKVKIQKRGSSIFSSLRRHLIPP